MSQLANKIILFATVLLLVTIVSVNAESDEGFLSIFPKQITSWVEVKVDSLNGAEAIVQETAAAALDSMATEQNIKYDAEKITYFTTYMGIWTEMEGRGRRARPVQKGFIYRMKAIATITTEE
jgi:hypothetical protein